MCLQVSCNVLLLECLTAAGQWAAARQHVEALQRCLPLKTHGPVADAAVEVAGWRARCLARAPSSDRMMEDMNRLLSELSTPQAKVSSPQRGVLVDILPLRYPAYCPCTNCYAGLHRAVLHGEERTNPVVLLLLCRLMHGLLSVRHVALCLAN